MGRSRALGIGHCMVKGTERCRYECINLCITLLIVNVLVLVATRVRCSSNYS